jgi:hypothetical protein
MEKMAGYSGRSVIARNGQAMEHDVPNLFSTRIPDNVVTCQWLDTGVWLVIEFPLANSRILLLTTADTIYYYYYLVCEAIGTASTPGHSRH